MYYGLATAIEKHELGEVGCISDSALAILDNHLYGQLKIEPSEENDALIQNQPWIVQELMRQRRDLDLCATPSSVEDIILNLGKNSLVEGIFDSP